MAKKAPSKKTKKKTQSSASGDPPFDVRALESFLSQLGPSPETDDPLAQAQDIMWDAWDLTDRRRRIALAKKALKISPLCADAYVMLAIEAAADNDEALDLYRRGVEAGEKAIGEAAFRDDVGHFWGILETRPYMRARQGLAQALWALGQRDEAVAHYRDMLRLNPNDNQGIRYLLIDCLLTLGWDGDAAELIKRYADDGAAAWAWSEALLSFRRGGDTASSRAALSRARKTNRHVPAYLLGHKKMPRQLPTYISWGGVDEAIAYVEGAAEAWAAAPGALEWLAAAAPSRAPRRVKPPARKG